MDVHAALATLFCDTPTYVTTVCSHLQICKKSYQRFFPLIEALTLFKVTQGNLMYVKCVVFLKSSNTSRKRFSVWKPTMQKCSWYIKHQSESQQCKSVHGTYNILHIQCRKSGWTLHVRQPLQHKCTQPFQQLWHLKWNKLGELATCRLPATYESHKQADASFLLTAPTHKVGTLHIF
jgi:hypothetical protein